MRKRYPLLARPAQWLSLLLLTCPLLGRAQVQTPATITPVSLAALGTAYTEDFNSLTLTPSSTVPAGWAFTENPSDGVYGVPPIASTDAGGAYSLGTTTGTDRAFGTLFGTQTLPAVGVVASVGGAFTNNTGQTITGLLITYTGEEWRNGSSVRTAADRLDFQYSTTATSLTSGTYTDYDALDFSSPRLLVGGTLSGNDPLNRTTLSASLSVTLAPGATIYLRWLDIDAPSGTDDALGIDDFFITAVQLPTLTTTAATAISSSAATVGGTVNTAGSTAVTARGVVYGTSPSPVLGGTGVTAVAVGAGLGSFSTSLSGLSPNTLYYVSAYATNGSGTAYGPVQTFLTAVGQISISALNTAYTQDFNTLSNSGTTNLKSTLPLGWDFIEKVPSSGAGSSAPDNTYSATSSNTGDTYSLGSTGSTDRAFGMLQNSGVVSTIGAYYVNNTGSTITGLTISYTGEMWRIGTLGRTDQMEFQYSLDAPDVDGTTGTYVPVAALTFTSPNNTAVGAVDGNLAANRTALTATVPVSIAPGATFFIRWIDVNVSGTDDALGVDDFSLTATAPAGPPCVAATAPTTTAISTTGATVGFTPSTSATSYTVTYQVGTGTPVTVTPNPTASPVTLTGLTPGTSYSVSIVSNCAGGASSPALTTTFTTTCPAVAFTLPTGPYCVGGTGTITPTLGTGAVAGTFSASPAGLVLNATTGVVTLSGSAAGTYTITNTLAATGGCPVATATQTLTINALPTATLTATSATSFCGSGPLALSATPVSGATYEFFRNGTSLGAASSTATYSATISASGSYTVTVTSAAGCSATSAPVAVTVSPVPSAAFAYGGSTFCQSGTNPTPTISGATGGTFSAPAGLSLNASTGAINLAGSTLGTYVVTYSVAGTCPASSTQTVTVTSSPSASFSYPAGTICAGSAALVSPSFGTGASAGTFSAGAGLTISSTGVINPATSTAGTYTVTNTIAASGSCPAATATQSVTITPATTATFSYGGTSFCRTGTTNPTATITGTMGGTFSVAPATGLSLNTSTGAVTLSSSTAGTYTVTYAVTGTCPSSSTQTLTITNPASATFSYPTATICAGQTATVSPTAAMGATLGTFTVSPATGLTINAATGVITPSTSTAGTYTVTNTLAAAGGCAAVTSTQTVTITPATTATFSYGGASFCRTGATNPTATVTGTMGGTFSVSPATGLTLNATTGAVTLSSSTAGTYTVTYSVAGTCPSSSTQTVTITNPQSAGFSYASNSYCTSGTASPTVQLGIGATAGTFSVSPASGLTLNATTGALTLSSSAAGMYTVTNTLPAANGCAAVTATTTVTIVAAPTAAFTYPAPTPGSACAGGTGTITPTLGMGATAGTFSSTTGLSISPSGVISLATSTAGTYTITNTVPAANGCAATTATQTFTVNPRPAAPTVTTSGTPATGITLTSGTVPAGSTYQWFLNNMPVVGATSASYLVNSGTKNGSYTLVVASPAGCASPASMATTVTVTGNVAARAAASLLVAPNPTPDGRVLVTLSGYQEEVELTVFNTLGQPVLRRSVPASALGQPQLLNLSTLPAGAYVLQARSSHSSLTRRVVRE